MHRVSGTCIDRLQPECERPLQVGEAKVDMGLGLQAAMRTFGNALEKLPIVHIRSPCMYSLAQPALVGSLVSNNAKLKAETVPKQHYLQSMHQGLSFSSLAPIDDKYLTKLSSCMCWCRMAQR